MENLDTTQSDDAVNDAAHDTATNDAPAADTTTNDVPAADAPAADAGTPPVVKVSPPRRLTSIDASTGSVTFHAMPAIPAKGDVAEVPALAEESFSHVDLKENVVTYLATIGLRLFLSQGKSPADAFARLEKGDLPAEKVAGAAKAPAVNLYRQAIANVLIASHAAANKTLSPEDALTKAMNFDRSAFAKLKGDKKVMKEYLRLSEGGSDETSEDAALLTA